MKQFVLKGSLASLRTPPNNDASADKPGKFWFVCALFFSMLLLPSVSYALQRSQADEIPHVNQQARENFVQYIYADNNKAFAIAPGGAWAWTEGELSKEEAGANALQRCQRQTEQDCIIYSLNNEIVFDAKAWPGLWRLNHKTSQTKTVGVARGNHFPNLRFNDKQGKPRSMQDFAGKITLVHFWGSWCPPCLREMPELLKMQAALKQNHGNKVAIILLQVREPFTESSKWAKKHQFDTLPLYDSGVKNSDDDILKTVDGKTYPDRKIAMAFPTSYVLDRKGRVLFTHKGPVKNWSEYLAFFSDVVNHNSK